MGVPLDSPRHLTRTRLGIAGTVPIASPRPNPQKAIAFHRGLVGGRDSTPLPELAEPIWRDERPRPRAFG
jgi:hypothetical protein